MRDKIIKFGQEHARFQTADLVRAGLGSAAEACHEVKAMLTDGALVHQDEKRGRRKISWLMLGHVEIKMECPRCGQLSEQVVTCPRCGREGCIETCCPGGLGVMCVECEENLAESLE